MKLKPHHGTHHSKDNDYHTVTHSIAEPLQCDDSLELKETEESQADKDKNYYFVDTTLIGEVIMCHTSVMRIVQH